MTQAMIPTNDPIGARIEEVLFTGNLSVLTPTERVEYVTRVCDSLGMNPLTKPFEYITLNGKLTLYATKAATDQLRQLRGVSISITNQQQLGDLYVVTVTATDRDGRQDSDMGVVATGKLTGENLANAMLKAVTKAKRRVTLSICGLGMLDETEIEDIPASAKRPPVRMPEPVAAPSNLLSETGEIPSPPEPVDTETGEIAPAAPLWTKAELKAALTDAALTVGDLSGVLGEQATPSNYADLIDAWMFDHPGQRITDLTAAAVAYHMGAESQPALPGND